MFSLIDYEPPTYHNGDYHYPRWAEALGWIYASISLICIPGYAAVIITRAEGDTLMQVKANIWLWKICWKLFVLFFIIICRHSKQCFWFRTSIYAFPSAGDFFFTIIRFIPEHWKIFLYLGKVKKPIFFINKKKIMSINFLLEIIIFFNIWS